MTLRWGFLGASRIGRRALAPAVLEADGQVLDAVAARDADRARAFAAEFGAARAYGSYAALIDDPGLDAIYNALPNDAHAPWTIRALEAGKHVLCEKPLTLSAAEVVSLQDAERRTGRRVMEAFCHLFHPQIDTLRRLLAEGAIGRMVAMHAVFGNTLAPGDDFRWRAGHGGGALDDIGGYCVSAMRALAGREPVRVSAVQDLAGEVDATMGGMLDFGDGLAAHFTCSFAAAYTQHFALLGTTGRALMDWPFSTSNRSVRLMVDDREQQFAIFKPYLAMVEHFARVVAGEAEMQRGLAWSLGQAQVLDALFEAARGGGGVVLTSAREERGAALHPARGQALDTNLSQ